MLKRKAGRAGKAKGKGKKGRKVKGEGRAGQEGGRKELSASTVLVFFATAPIFMHPQLCVVPIVLQSNSHASPLRAASMSAMCCVSSEFRKQGGFIF